MDGKTTVSIDGKQWAAMVPLDSDKPFTTATFSGKTVGLVDSISPYLGDLKEPFYSPSIPANSFLYSNILPVRRSDVMLVTAPKTGTTLMQQLCHQIKNRGRDDSMDFRDINDVSPWLDLIQAENIDIESMKSPRIFKTHRLLSDSRRGCKYIATMRNPEDTCKSHFVFLKELERPIVEDCSSASELVLKPEYLSRKPFGGTLWDYYQEFWKARDLDDLLVLPYEYIVENLEEVIPIVAEFIGEPPLTADELSQVVRKCKKEYMGSEQHKDKFVLVTKSKDGTNTERRVRKVNLDKKADLSDEAKKALELKWKNEIFPSTGKTNYKELSEEFIKKIKLQKQ